VTIRPERMEVRSRPQKKKIVEVDESCDPEIFDALKALRREIASEQGIPPYIVFSDRTLRELSVLLPGNREEMLSVHGVGEVKFERYGERFLEKIGEFSS